MQFKQQKKYSLINTFCVFIENYSLNERSLLVFENTLLPIIINNNELHNTTSYAVFNIHYIIEYLLEDLTQNDNASEIITICKRCNSLLENNIGLLKGINIISFINNFKTLLLSELKPSGIAFKFVIRCLYKLAFHLDYEGNGSQYSLYFKTKGSTLQQRNIKHEIMKTIQEQFEIKIKNIINIINKEPEPKSKVKGSQILKQFQLEQASITTEELNNMNSLFQNVFLLFSCMNIYLYSL
jgi:ribosomal protein L23